MPTPRRGIHLIVEGVPAQQGSKTQGVTRSGRRYVREDNANDLRKWRKAIVDAAERIRAELGPIEPLDGPLSVSILFTMPRPASVRRRYPSTAPDLDKLIRAIFDGLGPKQAGFITDDSRIVELGRVAKLYPGDPTGTLNVPGADIRVEELDPHQEALPL